MGVYIKGMEMPEDCAMLLKIFPDGSVGVPVHRNWMGTMVVKDAEAVPVPPHGRLIDADEMIRDIKKAVAPTEYIKNRNSNMIYFLQHQETVIPADPAEEGE